MTVDRALRKSHFINEDLEKMLVPAPATLFETVECLNEFADLVGRVSGVKAWGLSRPSKVFVSVRFFSQTACLAASPQRNCGKPLTWSMARTFSRIM